jgi:hypothetical protein
MTGSWLRRWIQLFLAFFALTVPVSGARAGDAYKPTPAATTPAKPSDNSDAEAGPDDPTMDTGDEPSDSTPPPPPPKATRPRPGAATTPSATDSGGGDPQGQAQTPAAQASDPERALRELWEEKARKADERVAAAQARLDNAQHAYTNMRMRSYPTGDAKGSILKEIDDAKADLADAQAARAALEDEARQAGIPPSWIMP